MTTHAKHANSDLHGGSTRGRLVRLLARYDSAAAAIRTTLALLDGDAAQTKTEKAGDVLRQAIRIDTVRAGADAMIVNGNGSGRPAPAKAKPSGAGAKAAKAKRRRTAALLDTFSTTTPRPNTEKRPLSVLLQHGYLTKKGDGYVRTAKQFVP